MWRQDQRSVPVESVLDRRGRSATAPSLGTNGLLFAGPVVVANNVAALRLGKVKVRIVRIIEDPKSIPEVNHCPIVIEYARGLPRVRRSRPAAIVLESSANIVVRTAIVRVDVVDLTHWNIIDIIPVFT